MWELLHGAPANIGNRLVIDVGGGSTEFIIGQGYEPKLLESLYIGCVSHSQKFLLMGPLMHIALTGRVGCSTRNSDHIERIQKKRLGSGYWVFWNS
jgi:hypothetical protein